MKALHTFTVCGVSAQNPALQNHFQTSAKMCVSANCFTKCKTRAAIYCVKKNRCKALIPECGAIYFATAEARSELKGKNLENIKSGKEVAACVLSTCIMLCVPHASGKYVFRFYLDCSAEMLAAYFTLLMEIWKETSERANDHTLYILMQPQWKKLAFALFLSALSSVSAPTLGLIASPALEST